MDPGFASRRLRRRDSPDCARSFARYCIALLGSLGAVTAHAMPVSARRETVERALAIARRNDDITHGLRLVARQTQASINKAATIVGICAGFALIFAIIGGVLYTRQRHRSGKCKCSEKGVKCKYRSLPLDREHEQEQVTSRPRGRGATPPGSPRQLLLSGGGGGDDDLTSSHDRVRWSVSSPRDSTGSSTGPFYDVEGFEYPPNYKPPPSSFRAHSPSASAEFLVPAGIANLISPVSPLLGPPSHRLSAASDDVTITPPRTPSPARFAKRAPSPSPSRRVLRGRSLSAVDLSRSDGELQEDLDAIVRELQRRPRAGSIDGRLAESRSNSPAPAGRQSQESINIMELEASPGMWNEDMQRNRGVVHEAVSQEFAVELDSRPLMLGVKRTRRMTGRF